VIRGASANWGWCWKYLLQSQGATRYAATAHAAKSNSNQRRRAGFACEAALETGVEGGLIFIRVNLCAALVCFFQLPDSLVNSRAASKETARAFHNRRNLFIGWMRRAALASRSAV
jgi:hypothetical protein